MPTPVGHALGGLALALLADSPARRQHLSPGLLLASVAVAVAPDADLLVGLHRTYTHSLGAVLVVGVVSWLVARRRAASPIQVAAILMAAYASHPVLDWTGKDTSLPPGLTILWPFSSVFYISGWSLFDEVSRRYWLPREFILGNLQALAWELMLLAPILFIAWAVWSKRTLKMNDEARTTNKARPAR